MTLQFIEVELMNPKPAGPATVLRQRLCCRALLTWLLIAALPMSSLRAAPGDAAYKFAAGLYQNSRWDLASEKFRAFIRTHPRHPKLPLARLYLGLALVNLEKFSDARTQLRQFVKLYPKSRNLADATYRVAECSYLLNDYAAAETEFSQFLGLDPQHELVEWALPYLGDTLLQRKKMTLAAAAFQKSLEQHPQGRMADDARFGLGRCYEALDRVDDAVSVYRTLAANPSGRHADRAQLKVAAYYFSAGKFNEAAVAYDAVKTTFPNSRLLALAAINSGYSHYQLREYRKAIDRFTQAERDDKQAANAGYWKALSYKSLGDYPQAIRILSSVSKQFPKSDLADRIIYQLANSQLLAGRYAHASTSYLQIADRWPQSELADDSLHFAAESAVYDGQLDQAVRILKRISDEYPRSPLTKRNAILQGRVWQARGGKDNMQRASEIFNQVVQTSQVDQTRSLARLYLAQSLQMLQRHEETIQAVQPLVDAIQKSASKDHMEALVLTAISRLALADYPSARDACTAYLDRSPMGSKRARALATRAVAHANLQHKPPANADLQTLQTEFPEHEIVAPTILKMCEAVYADGDWAWATPLFIQLSDRSHPPDYRARGLSGLGWCQFQLADYDSAAATFQRVIKQHPQHELTAESCYMRGQSLQHAQRNAEATTAFLETFQRYAPQTPAPAGAESKGAIRRAFEAGRAAAQLLEADGKIDEADSAYNRLAQRFPKAQGIDEILEHWAFLNLEANKTDRSDALFRRLYTEHPNSDRADNARLQLAESLFVAGKLDQAHNMFQALLDHPKSDVMVRESSLFLLLRIAVFQKKWKDALTHSGTLNSEFPKSAYRQEARFYQGEALLRTDKPQEAQAILKELKTSDLDWNKHPWMASAWAVLAESYFQQKQYTLIDDLAAEFAQARKAPLPYKLEFFVGWSHIRRANWDESRSAFTRVVKDPQSKQTEIAAQSQFLIGDSWFAQEQFDQALEAYLAVTINQSSERWNPQALWQQGQCDEQLQKPTNARRTYRKLIMDYPQSPYAKLAKTRLESLP